MAKKWLLLELKNQNYSTLFLNFHMKKLILLLIIPIVFACGSDDSTSSNSSQNFLEKYDGVIWKNNDDDINVSKGLWDIFTPDGWEQTSYGYVDSGICETFYMPWNIVGNYGDWIKAQVINNSIDELIIEITETDSETFLIYITAINNGNSLHITDPLDNWEEYYTRDTSSNICN